MTSFEENEFPLFPGNVNDIPDGTAGSSEEKPIEACRDFDWHERTLKDRLRNFGRHSLAGFAAPYARLIAEEPEVESLEDWGFLDWHEGETQLEKN